MTIAAIRKLTDWQVHNLYFLPALRKAAKRNAKGNSPRRVKKGRKTRLPTKEEFIQTGIQIGVPREIAEQQWEKAQAEVRNGKSG